MFLGHEDVVSAADFIEGLLFLLGSLPLRFVYRLAGLTITLPEVPGLF